MGRKCCLESFSDPLKEAEATHKLSKASCQALDSISTGIHITTLHSQPAPSSLFSSLQASGSAAKLISSIGVWCITGSAPDGMTAKVQRNEPPALARMCMTSTTIASGFNLQKAGKRLTVEVFTLKGLGSQLSEDAFSFFSFVLVSTWP